MHLPLFFEDFHEQHGKPSRMQEKKHDVIIVGGGPVGMFLGLSLAKKDVEVLVLEAESEIVQSPRALMLV